jgi:phosphatidate cytidylyltransferase
MKRVLTGAALVPIVVYVVLGANYWAFLAVVALVALLCYREYDSIAAAYGFGAPGPLGYGAGLLLLMWSGEAWLIVLAAALIAFTFALRAPDLSHALPRSALLVAGVVYVFGAWKCAIPLRQLNPHWLMYALIVNWAGDIGAYYVGRTFGKHRLARRVSPKKSWEGAGA